MNKPYVYIEDLSFDSFESFIPLDAEESFHLCKVLRMRQGSKVLLTNGRGYLVECEIVEADQKETVLKTIGDAVFHTKRNYSIHIAIAPTKHPDRLEWFIEKATETGIDKISLIICEHSEKWNVKLQRLNRLMISAMKQSQQCWLPELVGPVSFAEMLKLSNEDEKYIGYCDGEPVLLSQKMHKNKSLVVAIGPEGDFSPAEIDLAQKNGFNPISLGPTRLRTETAGLAANMIVQTVNDLVI